MAGHSLIVGGCDGRAAYYCNRGEPETSWRECGQTPQLLALSNDVVSTTAYKGHSLCCSCMWRETGEF
jgi:hypothetical protein